MLDADTTSYTDTGLLGCTTYYYQMATIACDTNIPIAGMLFASANAVPEDNTPPSPPVITARPGYRRIILTLTNPYAASTDFKFTKVHWSTTANPTLTTVTPAPALGQPRAVILDGPAIPDNGSAGPYAGTGSRSRRADQLQRRRERRPVVHAAAAGPVHELAEKPRPTPATRSPTTSPRWRTTAAATPAR